MADRKVPEQTALDVWLRFTSPDDEMATYEANTFKSVDADGDELSLAHARPATGLLRPGMPASLTPQRRRVQQTTSNFPLPSQSEPTRSALLRTGINNVLTRF